jgi:hypothetical protein
VTLRRPHLASIVGVLSAVCGASALFASCLTPTQIELVITTDVGCSELNGVTITAGPPREVERASVSTLTNDCRNVEGGAEIGTIVVAPSGDKDSAVGIKVVAGVTAEVESCTADNRHAGCIVARRRLN